MISAWASANRLVLGPLKVDDKSHDITAIPPLLGRLEWDGATVTLDAMGCQTEIARPLVAHGAHDVLALKDTHATLHGEGKLLVETLTTTGWTAVTCDSYPSVDADPGRIAVSYTHLTLPTKRIV